MGNTAKRAARTFVLSRRRIARGGGDRNSLSPLIPRNLLILLNGRNYKNSEFAEPRTRRAHGTASLMGYWQAVREKDSTIDANTATTNIDMEFAGSGGSFGCMGGFRRAGRRRSFGCQIGCPNYFQNHVLPFSTPVDRVSSRVRDSATPCRVERTSLAIAGVRRLLLFR